MVVSKVLVLVAVSAMLAAASSPTLAQLASAESADYQAKIYSGISAAVPSINIDTRAIGSAADSVLQGAAAAASTGAPASVDASASGITSACNFQAQGGQSASVVSGVNGSLDGLAEANVSASTPSNVQANATTSLNTTAANGALNLGIVVIPGL